jgi:hypothetical protein
MHPGRAHIRIVWLRHDAEFKTRLLEEDHVLKRLIDAAFPGIHNPREIRDAVGSVLERHRQTLARHDG